MSNADAQIADFALTPITKSDTGQNTAVGMAARSIYANFGQDLKNNTTRCVVELALSNMTHEEYNQAEKAAGALAAHEDKANGWKSEGLKGRAAYGPRQSVMATMASQRRQVFGAIKHGGVSVIVAAPPSGVINFDTLPAFSQAVNKARAYLNNPTGATEAGDKEPIDWTGKPTADKRREKESAAEVEQSDKAMELTRAKLPKQPGEPYAAWCMRVLESAEYAEALEALDAEALQAKMQKVFDALVKEHGKGFVYELASMIRDAEIKELSGEE